MDYLNIDGEFDWDAIDRLVKQVSDARINVVHADEQYKAQVRESLDELVSLNTILVSRVKELEAENKQLKEENEQLKKRPEG